jgi:hypothetical protein
MRERLERAFPPRAINFAVHNDAIHNDASWPSTVLELTMKLEGATIAEIRFRAKGCVPAIACGPNPFAFFSLRDGSCRPSCHGTMQLQLFN